MSQIVTLMPLKAPIFFFTVRDATECTRCYTSGVKTVTVTHLVEHVL